MRLHVTAFALTVGLLWGLAVLLVAIANLIWPGYGNVFLQGVASLYPGYEPGTGIGSVIMVTLHGLVDGGIGGLVFAWLYNQLVQRFTRHTL